MQLEVATEPVREYLAAHRATIEGSQGRNGEGGLRLKMGFRGREGMETPKGRRGTLTSFTKISMVVQKYWSQGERQLTCSGARVRASQLVKHLTHFDHCSRSVGQGCFSGPRATLGSSPFLGKPVRSEVRRHTWDEGSERADSKG